MTLMFGKTIKVLTFAALMAFLTVSAGCGAFFFSAKKEFTVDKALEAYDYKDVYFLSYDGTRLNGWVF